MSLPRPHGPGPRLWLFALGLLVVLAAPALSPRTLAQSSAPQADSAVDVATRWVYALKRADSRMLDRTSVYPFDFRVHHAPCKCKDGKARDAAQLTSLLAELMQSEDVKALEVTSSDAKEALKGGLPSWAKRWGKQVPKGARLVQIEASGGVVFTLTFVVVVSGGLVRALWLNAATDGDA